MGRGKPFKKPKKVKNTDVDPDLMKHIRSVGLNSVEDYVGWCSRNGFSPRTQKHWRLRLKERAFHTRADADARLVREKREMRNPRRHIQAVLKGDLNELDLTLPYLRAMCAFRNRLRPRRKVFQAFSHLVNHLIDKGKLVSLDPGYVSYNANYDDTYLGGLLALAHHHDKWIRPLEEWQPRTHNAHRQFASLARHLLAHWPVPRFMDSVWFKGTRKDAARQQNWFIHIGAGHNIRHAAVPIDFTKKMAHHFLHAPSDYSAEEALRWGQIRAMGGPPKLVYAVIGTRLRSCFDHDEFWMSVFRFLIAHPDLRPSNVGPIIDYIQFQRFHREEIRTPQRIVERQPPLQPNLTMKGRTPGSLLRQVEAWHEGLTKAPSREYEWQPSGIEGFRFTEGSEKGRNLKTWTITELCSTKQLVAEGRRMKHCVATYFNECRNRRTSIWTLESESFQNRSKILTIEVDNVRKVICQAQGKCNIYPGEKHMHILRRWAARAGLQVASYIGS